MRNKLFGFSNGTKKILVLSFLLLGMVISGCSGFDAPPEEEKSVDRFAQDDIMDKGPQKGGSLRLFSTKPDSFNPLLTTNVHLEEYLGFIYEPMMKLDATTQPKPVLADKWELAGGGMVLNIHLRNNVLWQDGTPLTAYDVEFTMDIIQNPAVPTIYKKNLENVASFAAVDRANIKIMFKVPNTLTTTQMTFPILPKHYFQGAEITKLDSPKNMKPIGTGPYMFDKFAKDLYLKANPKWWNAKKKQEDILAYPLIDQVVVKVFASPNEAVSAFLRKDIDVTPVDIRESTKYSIRADTVLRKFPGRNFEFLALNPYMAAFSDRVLKQAMAMAMEREKILDDLMPGEATVADLPVLPENWLAGGEINMVRSDMGQARKLLDENGWADYGGVRGKRIGSQFVRAEFEMVVNNDNKRRILVAEKIRNQLAQVGIKLNIRLAEWGQVQNEIKGKGYSVAFTGVRIPSIPDISYLYVNPAVGGTLNLVDYNNPVVEQNLLAIKLEADTLKQKKLFAQTGNIILDDMPYIGVCFYNNAMLFSKKVRGNINPYTFDRYQDISEWYMIK